MRFSRAELLLTLALFGAARMAGAQSTAGTIRGHVADAGGLSVPGATVTVTSPNLQVPRVTVSSENGDYIFTLLPPGPYRAQFELTGFQSVERDVTLAATQVLPLDVVFNPAKVEERIDVVGASANVLARTTQVATSFPQTLISALPLSRDVSSTLLLAPGVHQTGPNGAYSIAGSFSFENQFLVNGVSVVENLRGQPHDLYIEDAIQETTVASGGVSAEYGRFTGGVVNIITKSGGNRFSGSFRDTLHNDKWRALTPVEDGQRRAKPALKDPRVDKTVPTYEYTFGGPAIKDKIWFFASGRAQKQESARATVDTNIPYTYGVDSKRFELNGTYSLSANHRVQGVYIQSNEAQSNQNFANVLDLNSLYNADRMMNLSTVNYSGVITPRLFLEARVSARNETIENVGGRSTDLVDGTLLVTRNQRRFWAPTFCGVCDPEQRDGKDVFVKASYFLSTKDLGSHEMVVGYDGYNDQRFANNHQSASDYRILGVNQIIPAGTTNVYAQFLNDGFTQIAWQPIFIGTEGTNFRTHSLFYNDNWRINGRVTANLGLRYDRNQGANGTGEVVTRDSAFSPRFGIVLDPFGDQKWTVTGSVAKYVAAIASSIADVSSPGGNFDAYVYPYLGPAINPTNASGVYLGTDQALKQLFQWFEANRANLPLVGLTVVRGLTPQIRESLQSPHAWEYSGGLGRQIGQRASIRTDFTYRKHGGFYAQRTDTSTGQIVDNRPDALESVKGRRYDLTLIENTDVLERQYAGLTTQGQYRITSRLDVGASYTLSRLWGNVDGETATAGPTAADILAYPEYKQASWNAPVGDLSADQRHRARFWGTYGIPRVTGLSLGVLHIAESGVPYGAVGGVNSLAFVANPGYVSPPSPPSSTITYYYTDRDAFRTAGQKRTDLAVNYARRVPGLARAELFGQIQVVNIFNHYQLCGCGASTVFQNGGAVLAGRLDQTVITPVTAPNAVAGFNPFTTTPQEGVNWRKAPSFGSALLRTAHTTPRTLRVSFGIRF